MEQEILDLQTRCDQLESVIIDILETFATHDLHYSPELIGDLSDIKKDFENLTKD